MGRLFFFFLLLFDPSKPRNITFNTSMSLSTAATIHQIECTHTKKMLVFAFWHELWGQEEGTSVCVRVFVQTK